VHYTCFGGPDINSEIWIVNKAPKNLGTSTMGNLFTEPVVRGKEIFFFEYNEFKTITLWKSENGNLTSIAIPEHLKNSHVHNLALLGKTFYFRYTDHKTGAHGEGIFEKDFTILPARGPEYFFKPSANGNVMLQKIKLADGEAIELRTKSNHTPVTIIRNERPFKFLRGQFALRGNKWATVATTDTGLTLIRGENEKFTTENLSHLFKDIQHWTPALADDGEVIFRATDLNNQFALWGYRNGKKRLIIGSGQEIKVESEIVVTSDRSLLNNPPLINEKGELFIGVSLRNPDESSDLGTGILSFPKE